MYPRRVILWSSCDNGYHHRFVLWPDGDVRYHHRFQTVLRGLRWCILLYWNNQSNDTEWIEDVLRYVHKIYLTGCLINLTAHTWTEHKHEPKTNCGSENTPHGSYSQTNYAVHITSSSAVRHRSDNKEHRLNEKQDIGPLKWSKTDIVGYR